MEGGDLKRVITERTQDYLKVEPRLVDRFIISQCLLSITPFLTGLDCCVRCCFPYISVSIIRCRRTFHLKVSTDVVGKQDTQNLDDCKTEGYYCEHTAFRRE